MKPFLCGSTSENNFCSKGTVKFKPCKQSSLSTKNLKFSNVILPLPYDALLKLSSKFENFFDKYSPICWIALNFQSKVLALLKPPPRVFAKIIFEFKPEVEYGFSSDINR